MATNNSPIAITQAAVTPDVADIKHVIQIVDSQAANLVDVDVSLVVLKSPTAQASIQLPDATQYDGRVAYVKSTDITNSCFILTSVADQLEDPASAGTTLTYISSHQVSQVGQALKVISADGKWAIV